MPERSGSRTGRTAWGSISREQIVKTAARLMSTEGYDQITIRAIAAEMGVAPMSLYRHVKDKDDILDEVVDRMLADRWRPRRGRSDWKRWIAEAAERLRRFLVIEPAALHVFLSHPVVSPAAVARMDAMMEVLRQELANEEAAMRAYGAIQTYTIGFAALEASRAGWTPSEDEGDATSRQLAAYTTTKQFDIGLGYLLGGIEDEAQPFSDTIAE